MAIHNLDKIFRPRRVAVVGASERPESVGNTVLRNLIKGKFPGNIYPVNHKRDKVEKLKAYPSVKDLPEETDLAIICTPAVDCRWDST